VLESGAGSGLLSILAARAGARRVYAFERDPVVACFLRQNVERSGCSGVVRIVEKDTRCATLDDLEGLPVDVVIAEHLSTWQITEPQVSVLNHVNRHLAHPWAVRIPERATNRLELACSRFRFGDAVELRTHYFGFSGVPRPRLLSAPTTFRAVDFGRPNEAAVDETVDVVATRDGVVNSLRLTSPLQISGDISFRSSDSLMPPVVVPLDDDLDVRAGEVVEVQVRYRCETTWSAVRCAARRTGAVREAERSEPAAAGTSR